MELHGTNQIELAKCLQLSKMWVASYLWKDELVLQKDFERPLGCVVRSLPSGDRNAAVFGSRAGATLPVVVPQEWGKWRNKNKKEAGLGIQNTSELRNRYSLVIQVHTSQPMLFTMNLHDILRVGFKSPKRNAVACISDAKSWINVSRAVVQ